jgi:hypothetical protein
MKTVLELNRPVKTRKPREVTIAELRAEIRNLKQQLKVERAHIREMLAIARQAAMAPVPEDICTCTPTRADFLR